MSTNPTTAIYRVTGMSCGHCAGSVTAELTAIDGVTDVAVEVATGDVTVTSTAPLNEDTVRAAIEEAGYELSGVAVAAS